MGNHPHKSNAPLTVDDFLDNPVVEGIQAAGAKALAKQDGWGRRKNSIAGAAQLVLQVANLAATQWIADAPWWVTLIIAVVIGVAEIVVHASMKGSVTPSVVQEIADQAKTTEPDRGGLEHVVESFQDVADRVRDIQQRVATGASGLPVYRGDTTYQR